MDVTNEVDKICQRERKERNHAYYLKNKDKILDKQQRYNKAHAKEISAYQKSRRLKSVVCEWCDKSLYKPGYVLKYHKHYFCDETCLGKWFVDEADGDIEREWIDTPENIEICEKENRAEW